MRTALDGLGDCFFYYFPLYVVTVFVLLVGNATLLFLIKTKLRYITFSLLYSSLGLFDVARLCSRQFLEV